MKNRNQMQKAITLRCGCTSVSVPILLTTDPHARNRRTTLETLRVFKLCTGHENNKPTFLIESIALQWIARGHAYPQGNYKYPLFELRYINIFSLILKKSGHGDNLPRNTRRSSKISAQQEIPAAVKR